MFLLFIMQSARPVPGKWRLLIRIQRYRVPVLIAAFWLSASACPARAENGASNTNAPAAATSATVSGSAAAMAPAGAAVSDTQRELGPLIDAGKLSGLRWPNFSDYVPYLKKFYETGSYALAWTSAGAPVSQALAMIGQFKQAQYKGLNPPDYDASLWDARLAALAPATAKPALTDLVRFDLAMTVVSMRYVSDLHLGRINPRHFKFGLGAGPDRIDLADFLRTRLLTAQDVPAVIASVERQHAGYKRAEAALAHYLQLAAQGDGPAVPVPAKSVRPGDPFAGIPQLVQRLRQLGDLEAADNPALHGTVYDGVLVDAVKHFQIRHGLEPDGVLGRGTIAELNKPLRQRIMQLDLALERYRWLPPGFSQAPILINIPEFRLRTLRRAEGGFLTMRVVVGKAYRTQTPVFADQMRYVIFRPYWNVPASIARAELIPKIARDPSYLASHGFEVVAGNQVITGGDVSAGVLDGLRSGAYQIRQRPGPKNALGLVKFVFPNSYNVYLHGTPAVSLFARARRDFSHGCIRLQDPVALAAWVLRDKPGWTPDRIREVMNGDQTVKVDLDHPIPVLILYSTAVVEPDGEVRFFDDIYGYDAKLEKALAAGYPYPG
jgi:murein L,D-transpeptidase YcbB/YkuD